MREVFKGWRRKAGCVALILATAAATAWCRSLSVQDELSHVSGGMNQATGIALREISSGSGILRWETIGHFEDFLDSRVPQSGWSTKPVTESGNIGYSGMSPWRIAWAGFEVAHGKMGRTQISGLAIPYWSLAVPLTLLSAWLILGIPRKKPADSSSSLPQSPIPNP